MNAEAQRPDLPHVRKRLPSRHGNSFYRDKSLRLSETLCGAPCGASDWTVADAKKKGAPLATLCEKCQSLLEMNGIGPA